MARYVIGRLIYAVPVLIVISLISFLLVHLSGDPVKLMLSVHSTPEDEARLTALLGLDRPLHVQYVTYMAGLARGDMGRSIKFHMPVGDLIVSRLPRTVGLVSLGLAFAVGIAVPLGICAASRPLTRMDNGIVVFALLLISVPTFWLAIMAISILAEQMRLLPAGGSGGLRYIIMPAMVAGANTMGVLISLLRANLQGVLRQDYIKTARSKGLSERVVLFRHALKNALIPTVTVIGMRFGILLGGSIIIETVFAWPGFGWLVMEGVYARDLPLVRGAVLVIGVVFVATNLAVDILYSVLDPRIKFA